MACKAARATDEYHGWECEITGGECMFMIPNSKACAERYGEGPDAEDTDPGHQEDDDQERYLKEWNDKQGNRGGD